GADVDDGSAARLKHAGQDVLGAEEGADEVDVEDAMPVFELELVRGSFVGDAGDVEQDVDGAEAVGAGLDQGFDFGLAADVGAHEEAFAAGFADFMLSLRGGLVHVGGNDAGALLGEELRNGFANSHGGSGHQSDAVLQTHFGETFSLSEAANISRRRVVLKAFIS